MAHTPSSELTGQVGLCAYLFPGPESLSFKLFFEFQISLLNCSLSFKSVF